MYIQKKHHQYLLNEYWFWRDSNAQEIDLMAKRAGGFDIFEIKPSQTILPRHFKQLDYFEKIAKGKVKNKTLVYGGGEGQERTEYKVRVWDYR